MEQSMIASAAALAGLLLGGVVGILIGRNKHRTNHAVIRPTPPTDDLDVNDMVVALNSSISHLVDRVDRIAGRIDELSQAISALKPATEQSNQDRLGARSSSVPLAPIRAEGPNIGHESRRDARIATEQPVSPSIRNTIAEPVTPAAFDPSSPGAEPIRQDYNRAVLNFSEFENFRLLYRPAAYDVDNGIATQTESGKLWVIRSSEGPVLAPASRVVQDWPKFYRQLEGVHAQELLGDFYDFLSGQQFEIQRLARLDPERKDKFVATSRGVLVGL